MEEWRENEDLQLAYLLHCLKWFGGSQGRSVGVGVCDKAMSEAKEIRRHGSGWPTEDEHVQVRDGIKAGDLLQS